MKDSLRHPVLENANLEFSRHPVLENANLELSIAISTASHDSL